MSINENTIIFNKLYRSHYDDKEYFFEEILKKAILRTLTDDTVKAETMAANKVNRLWNSYKKQYEENSDESVLEEYIFCIFKVVTVGYNVIQGSDKGRATNKLNDIYAQPRRKSILNLKSFPQTPTSPLSMNIYTGTKYPGTFCSA